MGENLPMRTSTTETASWRHIGIHAWRVNPAASIQYHNGNSFTCFWGDRSGPLLEILYDLRFAEKVLLNTNYHVITVLRSTPSHCSRRSWNTVGSRILQHWTGRFHRNDEHSWSVLLSHFHLLWKLYALYCNLYVMICILVAHTSSINRSFSPIGGENLRARASQQLVLSGSVLPGKVLRRHSTSAHLSDTVRHHRVLPNWPTIGTDEIRHVLGHVFAVGDLCSNGRPSVRGRLWHPDGDVLRSQLEHSGYALFRVLYQIVRDVGVFATTVLHVVLPVHDAGITAGNLRLQSDGFSLFADYVLLQQANQIFEVYGYSGNGISV